MNYAFWIAIAVVFIAIAPAIWRGSQARRRDGSAGGEAGGVGATSSDRGWDGDCDGGGDGGGGD